MVYNNISKNYTSTNEKIKEITEEEIDKLLDKHFENFEQFKAYIINNIDEATKEIAEGKCMPMEDIIKEMEEQNQFNEKI